MKITTRELGPKLWPELERLFGANGACGGCWCMSWRREKGEDWEKLKGAKAKSRFKDLVLAGKAHGVLAFVDDVPVGWCSFDQRLDYPKLDRSPSLKCDDADRVWSIPCFFVHRNYRKQGVGEALLKAAVASMNRLGAEIMEGYPAKVYGYGKAMPAAFAWTGTTSLFKKAGFSAVGKRDGAKQRVRLLARKVGG